MLSFLKQLGCKDNLSLRLLTLKTAMLMALTRLLCSADFSSLGLKTRSYVSNGVIFNPIRLSKQIRSSTPISDFSFPPFQQDTAMCLVITLRAYESRTEQFRNISSGKLNLNSYFLGLN